MELNEEKNLIQTAEHGDLNALDSLILQQVTPSSLVPLFVQSIRSGNLEFVKRMLAYGLSPNKLVDFDLPLNHAIEAQQFSIVELLVSSGVEVAPSMQMSFSPLTTLVHEILKGNPPDLTSTHLKLLEFLLNHGACNSHFQLSSIDQDRVVLFPQLNLHLQQHGWHPDSNRIGHGGPP